MATDTEKLATVNNTNTSAEENPKNTLDSKDHIQNPSAVESTTTVSSTANGVKNDSEDSKSTVAAVSPASGNDEPASSVQKKIRRAERFGMPVQLSEEEKRNSRAERFGIGSKTHGGSEVSKSAEEQKRKARAERFGLSAPALAIEEEAKKKARLARFAPYSKPDSQEEDKRKARALRFSESQSKSSKVNDNGNVEPKAAITGKAGGGT